ncbi:hypothetical protein H4R18_000933 [Coemansia javaensis]|uniref:Trypsin-like serine protease n=1 Tax=Coemansia javaensis TaxID=2761396 RepID=A0A9W8HEG4_9FUNG|nr:hypothetical protein H4R18_000933 [Coemansia javaensis]
MLASGVPRTTLPMGILWEDGAPTSCGLVFISDTVAVGAASCYDTNENMAVDHRRYAVYMSSPEVKTPQPLLFGPAVMVMLHPAYDPTTFANNIALLWFQPNAGAPNIHFAIASAPSMWTKAQVFRTMNNGAWTDNMSDITPEPPIAKRQAASELFNFNQGDFYCNVLGSAINNGCALPYKATYGIANDQLAYVGVYSHSAAAKSTFPCEAIVVYHYYLNIANFIPWINTLVQPSVVVGVLPNQLPGPADPAPPRARQ